jgi:hypothetical protein
MAAEDIQDIRTLIPDDEAVFGDNEDEFLFTDEQLDRFFRLGGSSALRAAGLAMIAVGNSESLIGKVITTQDLSTDASKLQKEWRDSGKELIRRADLEDADAVDSMFTILNFREGWLPANGELVEDGSW